MLRQTFCFSQHSDRKTTSAQRACNASPYRFFTNTLRNYRVKSVNRKQNAVSISLITSDISILSRETPTLPKRPTLSTRADCGGTPPRNADVIKNVRHKVRELTAAARRSETPTLPKCPTLSTRTKKFFDLAFHCAADASAFEPYQRPQNGFRYGVGNVPARFPVQRRFQLGAVQL